MCYGSLWFICHLAFIIRGIITRQKRCIWWCREVRSLNKVTVQTSCSLKGRSLSMQVINPMQWRRRKIQFYVLLHGVTIFKHHPFWHQTQSSLLGDFGLTVAIRCHWHEGPNLRQFKQEVVLRFLAILSGEWGNSKPARPYQHYPNCEV